MYDLIEKVFFFIKDFISSMGYFGLTFGMMLESMCIPLPSEMVLPLGGFMAADGSIDLWLANLAVAAGSLTGSLIAYFVGFYGGRPFILNYGKYFFVSEGNFFKAEKTFKRYGSTAVFFGRLLPVIRTFISLPAGISKMDLKKFIFYSLLGMLPWNFVLIFLGYKLGQQYDAIVRPIFKRFEFAVIGVIIFFILFFIIKIISKRKKGARYFL